MCQKPGDESISGGESNQLCQMKLIAKIKAENWPSSNLEAIHDFVEHLGMQ